MISFFTTRLISIEHHLGDYLNRFMPHCLLSHTHVVVKHNKICRTYFISGKNQAWANRRKNQCFPERLQRARDLRSPNNFRETLFGACVEFALGTDAPNSIERNLLNFEIKFLCLGVFSCYLSPRDFSDGLIDTIRTRRNSKSISTYILNVKCCLK